MKTPKSAGGFDEVVKEYNKIFGTNFPIELWKCGDLVGVLQKKYLKMQVLCNLGNK